MPKIPLWMAGVKVRFISDEARQKQSTFSGIIDPDHSRRSLAVPPLRVASVSAVSEGEDEQSDDLDNLNEEVGDEDSISASLPKHGQAAGIDDFSDLEEVPEDEVLEEDVERKP
ncbi:MAG TPA: hypothetical protein VGS41_13475 [Chthonomonadales bacterium]|nr:hypothetical protein [Chthonomonadales bacterium]